MPERESDDRGSAPKQDLPPVPKPLPEPPEDTPVLSRGSSSRSTRSKSKLAEEPESPYVLTARPHLFFAHAADGRALPPSPLPRRRSSTKHVNQVYRIPAGGRSVPALPSGKGHQKNSSSDIPPPMPAQADAKRASYPAQFDVVIAFVYDSISVSITDELVVCWG